MLFAFERVVHFACRPGVRNHGADGGLFCAFAPRSVIAPLDGFVKNAETDLEAAIAEASDVIGEGEIALLPDRAVAHAERISRLKQQVELHVKVREKLKADINAAAMVIKRAMDNLELARRPFLQQVSARLAEEIDALEERSSQLRDQLRGMSNSAPGGLDDLALRALNMVRGWAPPPTDDPQTNSPRWHRTNAWAEAYRTGARPWRQIPMRRRRRRHEARQCGSKAAHASRAGRRAARIAL
jgi:hypothetical protein